MAPLVRPARLCRCACFDCLNQRDDIAKAPFDVETCILCEDVREEKSNKHSLIGVYGGDILISAIPGMMSVAFYLELKVREAGEHEIQFRLSGPGKHSAILRAGVGFPEANAIAVMKTPRIDLGVDEAGTFKFDLSMDGKKWKNLISKKVSLMPGPTS